MFNSLFIKKLLPVVLIVCSLVITGSVGAYFLYILPQIETSKIENAQPKEEPGTTSPIVEEVKPNTQAVTIAPVKSTPVPIAEVAKEEPKKEPEAMPKEDSALMIEKCKVNSNQTAKEAAEEAKKNYLSQKVNSGFCLFPESQTTLEARATINRVINQYKVELNAALNSQDEYKITKAKTDLLKAETALSQLESSLQAQTNNCLNGVIADSENFYKEVYQQKYDTAYQQCINGQ